MPLFRRRRPAGARAAGSDDGDSAATPMSAPGVDVAAGVGKPDGPVGAGTAEPSTDPLDLEAAELVAADAASAAPADASGQLGEVDPTVPTPGAAATGPVPRDISELAPDEEFLDLGAIRLPTADNVLEGIEIQLQADPETGAVLALLLVDGGEKALELRAFAAPRHEPLWDEVRAEIAAEALGAGGLTQPVDGRWGTELLVQLGVELPDGQQGVQVTRFVGVDGPRWLIRGAFLGRAALEPDSAERLDAILAGVTVSRGSGPMAPREPLPFVIPGQPEAAPPPDEVERPPLEPFERGPEITEVR